VSAKVICRIDLGALARACDDHIGDRHQRFDDAVEGEPHHIITAGVDNQPVELDVAVAEVLIGYGLVPLDGEFGVELVRELGVLLDDIRRQKPSSSLRDMRRRDDTGECGAVE